MTEWIGFLRRPTNRLVDQFVGMSEVEWLIAVRGAARFGAEMKSKKSGADNGQKLILQNHWSSPRWRDTPRARDRSGSGRVAPLPDRSSYCTSPPVFCDARSIQLSSAWVGYFGVGPALTFEVSATDAVARISVAMSV